MSKNCIITTVKSKIKGNATSYIEKENEIFIPISKKFTLNQTRAMAQDKVNKINKEYLSEKFGNVVSLNTSYTDGTGINIHPSQRLVDAYEVKEGNKTIQEVNTLSNRNIEYFNGEDALLVQDEDDRELKVQKELDKIVENINNIKFDENGQGLLFGNLQNLAKSNRIAVGEIKVENKKITGFNKKPNPYLRDYNTDLTEVQAKKLFEKTNKSTKDYEGLAVYFANMFVNEIIDKDVHLKMGYMRLAEYSQQKPKILITDTNKKINPFYQYNNTIIVGIYQLQQLLENGNYSDYQKFQNLIQSVAQEESIHLFAEYLLSKETVDNIYSEMSEKDIQKIKDIYENENLDKNGIVHEYVRMVVQQHVFNSTTEQEKVKLTNSVLDFISKMINEIQQFLSEIIGQNNTQKAIEDVINFTKGNFSKELDEKIINRVFDKGQILEANLNVLNNFQEEQEELDKIVKQTNNIKENETPASEIKEGVEKPLYSIENNKIKAIKSAINSKPILSNSESSFSKLNNKQTYPEIDTLFQENSELASQIYEALGFNQIITPNDKIVFGHPGLGKTYLKESGRTDIIDFDSDYKTKINEKFNLPKGFKARNDFQKSNKEEYQKAVRELWIEAKQEVKKTGKQLFASDMILLREFASDFDKVITMSKDTFINRAKQRNDYTSGETESWKNSLDIEISKLDKSKVFNTDKYLSDLFITPQQKQQAISIYSQYLEQNPNGSVEQFKNWIDEFNNLNKKDYSLIRNIESLKEGDFIQEGNSVAKIVNIDKENQKFDFILIDDLNNVESNNYNWYKDFFKSGQHKIKKATNKSIEKFTKSEQILKAIYDKNKNIAKSSIGKRFLKNFLGYNYNENKILTEYLNSTKKIDTLDVLSIIEKTDNEFKYIAKIIKDIIINNNYEISITQNNEKEGVAGDYIDGKINMYISTNDSQYTRVIIHELLHAISDNNVFQHKIDKLYNYVTKFLKDNNIDYGLKNNREFLAEIFSNKVFQELMAQFEYSEPNQNKKLSVLDKFLELLSSFFKIENNSVLKEAFLILEDISKYNTLNTNSKNQNFLFSKKLNSLSDFITQKSQERLNQIQDIFNENPELSKIRTNENNRTRENESTSTSRENDTNGRDYYLSETFKEASENFIWSSEDGHRYNFGSLSVIQGLAERTEKEQRIFQKRNKISLERNRGKLEYSSNNTNIEKYSKLSFNEIWQKMGEPRVDLEANIVASSFIMQRILQEPNQFYSRFRDIIRKQFNIPAIGEISLTYEESPLWADKDYIGVNLFKIDNFAKNSIDFNDFISKIDKSIEEEFIHLAVNNLTTDTEILQVFSEMTDSQKKNVKEIYKKEFDYRNKEDQILMVHEFIRMIIQNKYTGKITESSNPILLGIINRLLNKVKEWLGTEAIKTNEILNRFDNLVNKPQFNISEKSKELSKLPNNQWFNRTIQPIINRFSKMFPNVRSVVISEKEIPNEVKSIVNGLDKQINSFFHKGQVYIIKERITKDIAIEEFLHPFVNALEQDNPELYKSLLLEAKKLFPELKEEVFTKYGKIYGSIFDLNREFLTQALTKKVSEQTPAQETFFQKFKSWIKDILNKLFGEEAFTRQLSELDEQMSLTDLASILNENNTQFNFNSDTNTTYYSLSEEEVINYLNLPKNPIQAEILNKILENNKVTQTDFTGDKHEYTRNELGEILQLKPVSSFLSKKINPELDFSDFAQIGNAIHEIVKNINLNLLPRTQLIDTFAEKSDLKKILVDEKGYPIETVKQILNNIYDYITPLIGTKESLLVSEVSISALQDLEDFKGVAGTIDLLEITKDGNLVIHDFKSMYLNGLETIVYTKNPSTQLENKFKDNEKAYGEQLSLYAKMLKDIVGNKNITLQIVPIGYLAVSETKDNARKVLFSDELVRNNISLRVENYVYSPFTLINAANQQTKFQVNYNKPFTDKILPSIKDVEEKKLTKEEIDKQELLNSLTDKIKTDNSKALEIEIEKVFKQVTTVVSQYGNSQNELNQELFKIFDPKGELKETKTNFEIIFKNISDKKGDELKYYLSTLVQYINFIQEINVGLTNIKNHFHVIKSQEKSDTEKIAAYRKSYLLAKAQKERISKTLLQLDDISDDNLFKKMIKESIANIEEIEERYSRETLPLIANVLNSYITPDFRERMTKELTDRIAKEKYDLNLVTSESSKKNINEKIEELEQRLVAFNDPNLITKIIKGEYGDGHWFDSNLVANINNSNYVISGTAVMMQHILQDIAVEAMKMEEKFGKEFRQREEAYGVNRDQVKAMNKDMVTTVQRFFENPDGTIETLDSMQYIVKVNQQVYEDYKKLEFLFKNAKTETEKEKALKDIKDFEKLHFESKYNPKYLNVLNKLDVTVSDGRNVMEVRQKIFDQITGVKLSVGKEEYKEGNISDENLQTLRDLQRDLFNLSSSFDRNGNKKTKKADLEIAEILQKRAKELEEFRDKKVDEEVWKRLKTKKIQSLLEKYNSEEEVLKSEEYKKWQSLNSTISPTEDFYKLRQEKLEKINAILDKKEYKDIALVSQLKDNLNQSWEKLNALSREYRDFEREFISQDIPEGSKIAMKILEENIDKVKTQIKGLEKSLSKDDKKKLNTLWEDYNSMVEYKTSKYYEEDLEIALNKYALENDIEVSELRNDKALMTQFRLNSEWYINSHITKERYDKASGETVKYTEPVYYYKTIVPTNPDYIKERPAFQYSTFDLKPEAYNLDENGNPNYLDVFGRPKIKESSKYITENIPYLRAKNDLTPKGKINFQNLNFLTSALEEAQKDLNKNNLIYYQVPSKFKSTFQRGSEGDLKSIKQNIVDGLFRMTNDEKEFGTRGVLANLSGEEMQFIPVLGKYKLDFKDQSYDVWQSTLEYIMSAKKAKMFEERLPIFDVLVDQLEKNTPVEDPNKVEAIGNSMAKKFGLSNVTEAIKGKGTNTLQAVKDEISRGVYEEFTKELANWKGISDVKIANTVLGFAGTTMMIGKIANWTVNAMSGNVQVMIESAGKRYYTPTDVKNAKIELTKKSKEVLEDISKISDKSLIGQLTDFFDPMKGEFIDNLGNKFSWSKRTNLSKIFFFGKIFGEWEMQMTTFIAMLKAKKVEQILPNGTKKMIDLYDAFEKGEDGVPKLKEGVQFSQKDLIDYKLRIQGINKMLNGSYAKMDQTKIEKYSIGKATMFMKKYLIPLFVQRFGEFRGDLELQDVREGHYRIFYNALLTDIKNLGLGNIAEIYAKMNKPPEQGGYTDLQKQAIKKTLAEFAIIAAIFISLGLLGYDDGEDDSDSVKFAQYIALKLKREVGLFTPLAATQELTSLIERPFIAIGAASNVIDLVGTTAKLPFNWAFDAFEDDLYYQRKTALWDKGDSKLLSLIYKTAGLQVAIKEPEQLLQSYKYSIR